MATTKSRTSIWSAVTLTAGAGNTNSSWIDLSGSYGSTVSGTLTNGGTGPTIAAQVQIQVANDYNAGAPTLPINLGGAFIASLTASAVSYFTAEIPIGYSAIRLVAGSNTGQNVTVSADLGNVTAV